MMFYAIAVLFACADNLEPTTFVTWNTGLARNYVPAVDERLPLVTEAVADLVADVVCLQEVWDLDHAAEISASATQYENAIFMTPDQTVEEAPACAEGELDAFRSCLDEDCADACDEEMTDCALSSCPFPFLALDKTCQGCVMANVAESAEVIVENCTTGNVKYAYEGSFGLGLLSKHETAIYQTTTFESTTNRRGVLHALVDTPLGKMDVYCTHLSAIFSLIPYPREEGSWVEEQRAQIDELRQYVEMTRGAPGGVVLMGDFNNGPELAGLTEQWSEHYEALSEGCENPYAEGADPECTYCEDNGLNSEGSGDELIDHIFIDGTRGEASAKRILDTPVSLASCGEEIDGYKSDHYGIELTLSPKE